MSTTPPAEAREIWHRLETIHAVVYFAPEVTTACKDLGLKGFWMGYFATRAAALGAAPPALVTATFFNFHPEMVRRALPDAWAIAAPAEIVAMRRTSVAAALRRIVGAVDEPVLTDLAALTSNAARAIGCPGHPLAAAHVALAEPTDPVERLWWAATVLREHRGDAHVAVLVTHGLDGCEVHVLQAASGRVPTEVLRPNRGWSAEDWDAATARLHARGLVGADGQATAAGAALRADIEHATDDLSAAPYDALTPGERRRLQTGLDPIVDAIRRADAIPFPNPMGLAPSPF